MKSQRGFSLAAVLVLGTAAILAVSGLIGFANNNLTLGRRAVASEQAFLAAEAGLLHYMRFLSEDTVPEESVAFDFLGVDGETVGTYELLPGDGGTSVVSRGSAGGAERSIRAEFIQGSSVSFRYGIQAGSGGITLGNGAQIVGDVYSNGDIIGGNGSSITGDAYAAGSITNVEVSDPHASSSPQALPIRESLIAKWKDDASVDASAGDVVLSGSGNSLGTKKLDGNLTLSGDASLTVSGTIWITGDLILGNGAVIALSSAYGANGGVIVVDGDIELGNNAVLDGSGSPGSVLLLISLSDSASAITFGNNTGAVILYAPNGTVNIGNNSDIRILAGETVSLGNNVVLEYAEGLVSASFTSGTTTSWSLAGWEEVSNN